ncbi:MAG TPA: hypothetical protein VE631_03160 [Alphaproteobacteria bacterium]|nr:hypothetical protein [Alphaproteobacteria bacterium]
MSAAADPDALARRYLDLWERQLGDAQGETDDEAVLGRWLKIVAQAGATATAGGPEPSGHAFEGGLEGRQGDDQTGSGKGPGAAGAAAAAAASGNSDAEPARRARRPARGARGKLPLDPEAGD